MNLISFCLWYWHCTPNLVTGSVDRQLIKFVVPAHVNPPVTLIEQRISFLVKHFIDQCILCNCAAIVCSMMSFPDNINCGLGCNKISGLNVSLCINEN